MSFDKIPNLIMMVGLPGSGKSTYAKKLEGYGYVIHSSDELRRTLLSDVDDQTQNNFIFKQLHKNIKADLQSGKNVVYDATNIKRKRRRHFLNLLGTIDCMKYCIVVPTLYGRCLWNNRQRDRQVPQSSIEKMIKSFNIPHCSEGFDSVFIDYASMDYKDNLPKLLQRLCLYEQDNPHHHFTVGEHCKRAAKYIHDRSSDKVLEFAALAHDIGKPFCKAFVDSKGNPTNDAHFYGHENVSAYCSIGYLKPYFTNTEELLDAVFLINNHMRFMQTHSIKKLDKLKKQIGEKMMQRLILLHEADKFAS